MTRSYELNCWKSVKKCQRRYQNAGWTKLIPRWTLAVSLLLVWVGSVHAELQVTPAATQLAGSIDSTISLICSSSSKPILCLWKTPYGHVYTLSKGVFAESGRLRHKDDALDDECGLEIVGLEDQDSGQWECEVGSLIGDTFQTASANINLDVKSKSPTFHEGQTSRQEVGNDVILHCSADREVHLCRWKTPYLNTYIVGEGIYVERGRIQWLGRDPNFDCTIRVANLDLRDAGTWVCEIGSSTKESFQVQTKEFVIDIETPLKLSAPTALMQNANTDATLVCHANKPYDECLWTTPYGKTYRFPDQNSSHEKGRIAYFGFADTDCGIIVRNVQSKDNGGWQCQLHSRNGGIFQNATDTVSLFAEPNSGVIAQPRSIADYDYKSIDYDAIDDFNFDRVLQGGSQQRPTKIQLIPNSDEKPSRDSTTSSSSSTPRSQQTSSIVNLSDFSATSSGLPPPIELSKLTPKGGSSSSSTTSITPPLSVHNQDPASSDFTGVNPLELELLSRISGNRQNSRPIPIGGSNRGRFESTRTTSSTSTTSSGSSSNSGAAHFEQSTKSSIDTMRQLEIQRIRDERRKSAAAAANEERRKQQQEQEHVVEEEQRRQLIVERNRLEERRRKMDEQRRKDAEEATRLLKAAEMQHKEEMERQRKDELERQRKEERERQRKEERERQRKAELERQRKAELERQRKAELEAQRKAELEAQRKAELEAQRKAELEAQRKAELEAQRKAELEAQRKAELEAQRKAELEAQRQAELEAQRKAEMERKRKAEQERRRKEEQDRRRKAERERRRKEERERRRKMEEERRKKQEAEERRRKQEAERQKRIEEEKKKKEEEEERKKKEEEERQQKLEEERKRKEEQERRRKLEEERKRKQEEERLRKIEEEKKKKEEEERERRIQKQKEDEERKRQEQVQRRREEARRQREEERKKHLEEERKRKELEEQRKREDEARRKAAEERRLEEEKKKKEEEERKAKEAEIKRQLELERKRKEEEARRLAEIERRREEERRKQREEAEKKRKEEEERLIKEIERKKKEEVERLKAEAELKRKQDEELARELEEARRKELQERKRLEDKKREEDRQRRIELQRQRDETERQRRLEAEKQRKEEEERQKRLEEEKKKEDEERRKAEDMKKQREDERRLALDRVRQDRIKKEQEDAARQKQQDELAKRRREEESRRQVQQEQRRRLEAERNNKPTTTIQNSQNNSPSDKSTDLTSLIPRTESPRSFPIQTGGFNLPGTELDTRNRCYVNAKVSNGNITCTDYVPDIFGEYSVGHGDKCELSCKSGYVSVFQKESLCQNGRMTPRLDCVRPDALLLLAGRSDTHGVLNTVELVTNRGVCRGAVPTLPAMRWRMIAESIDKEHVLACGGVNIFGDPKKDCWLLGFSPEPKWNKATDMLVARDAAAWAMDGNLLIVLGGSLGKLNGYTDSVEIHNVHTRQWVEGPQMSSSRYSHCAVGLGNGSVIVTGGYGGLGLTERLDIDTGKWWPLPELNPVRAQHGCAIVDLDGEQGVLVVGGDSGGTRLKDVRFLPIERPEAGWRKVADLNTARWGRPGVAMVGGRITVAAGWDGVRDLDTVEYYDEKRRSWRRTASRLQFDRRWPASTPISLSLFPKCAQKRER